MASEFHIPLDDFLECFPAPQIGRIVGGLPEEEHDDSSFDIGPNSSLEFHRKVAPNVSLSFMDSWGGGGGGGGVEHWIKVKVPFEFPGRFQILPFDPVSREISVDHIFSTVEDLVDAFPIYVQANASYGNYDDEEEEEGVIGRPEDSFKCGDRLKLLRLRYRQGQRVLECRHMNHSRLLRLPMHCRGEFTVVPDHNTYLLSDLLALPARKRRVQLTDTGERIPGLPANFAGELFVDIAEYFVEVSPAADRSNIVGLPYNLNLTIAPNMDSRGQPLNTFATNNSNLFPLVARVTDWDEETTILENHYIKPGVELVIHGWTRQTKVLAQAGDQFYAIPLTYQGRFRIKPQRFSGVTELEKAHPAYKVKVVSVQSEDPDCPISPGDMLRIRREDSMKRHQKLDPGKIRTLSCEKFDPSGRTKIRDIRLPMDLASARFEEVLEDVKSSLFSARELVPFLEDQPVEVELATPSPDQKHPDRDLPPLGITLCDVAVESAVYVSVDAPDAPAFHVPLRTLLYVAFLEQLEKSASPLLTKQSPKLSTLDRCVELLPEEVYIALAASKHGGPEFPRFKGATAFSQTNSSQSAAWQKEATTSFTNGSSSPHTSPSSVTNGDPVPVFSMQQQIKATRQHRSTENLLQPPSPAHEVTTTTRTTTESRPYDEFSFGPSSTSSHHPPPPKENGHKNTSTLGRPAQVAVAHSDGGAMDAQFRSLQISRTRLRSSDDSSVGGGHTLRRNEPLYSSNPNLLSDNTTPDIPPGYGLVPQGPAALPQGYQPPPGYALVPISQQQQQPVPPGFMLVPFQQQQQQQQVPLTAENLRHYGTARSTTRSHRGFPSNGSMTSDSDNEDAKTNFSKFTFSSKVFKVAIPPDGNLYHFSTKKMAELFRQLKIDENSIRACLRDRIDGKKFSKMMEMDMERYGLMHPVVLHFRARTVKKKSHFML